MTETPPEIAALVRQKLMARSGEERFVMGVQMFEATWAMVLASLPADLSAEVLNANYFSASTGNLRPSETGTSLE